MDRKLIDEIAKAVLPTAESFGAAETKIKIDYNDEWEFFYGFRRKPKKKVKDERK